jgi:hypothetical protein
MGGKKALDTFNINFFASNVFCKPRVDKIPAYSWFGPNYLKNICEEPEIYTKSLSSSGIWPYVTFC